jgi:hypothetical protein
VHKGLVAAMAGGVLALAGCGAANTSAGGSQPGSSAGDSQAAAPAAITCTLANDTSTVQATVHSSSVCSGVQTAFASDGESWHPIASLAPVGQTSNGMTMQAECYLTKDGASIRVEDAGFMGETYGPALCSSYEQQGWTTP